jgi:hypothetical protein
MTNDHIEKSFLLDRILNLKIQYIIILLVRN